MDPKSQLVVAAAGLAANALVLLAALVWLYANLAHGADLGLRELLAWIKGTNQFFVAVRTGDFELREAAKATIVTHWDGSMWTCAISLSGIANLLALVVNLPTIPLRDGWHIKRAWKEMHGAPPLAQQEWDIKKSEDKRNQVKTLKWFALPAILAVSWILFH